MTAPPPCAEAVFGTALEQAARYAAALAGPGVERGLLGPAEAGRIWERHLLNCAAVAELVPAECWVVDVGSGAGLPGIVLAMLRPGARFTLVESLARRATFLAECAAELGLGNVEVRRARAEELTGGLAADLVTARAVAPLEKLAGWCAGLARPGGTVLAIKGRSAAAELARAEPVLARMGVTDGRVLQLGSGSGPAAATVVTFTVSTGPVSGARAAGRPRRAGGSGRRQRAAE